MILKYYEAIILQWNKFILKTDFKKVLWSNYPPMK